MHIHVLIHAYPRPYTYSHMHTHAHIEKYKHVCSSHKHSICNISEAETTRILLTIPFLYRRIPDFIGNKIL